MAAFTSEPTEEIPIADEPDNDTNDEATETEKERKDPEERADEGKEKDF